MEDRLQELEAVTLIIGKITDTIFEETEIAVTGFVATPKQQIMFTGPFSEENATGVMLTLLASSEHLSPEDRKILKSISNKFRGRNPNSP